MEMFMSTTGLHPMVANESLVATILKPAGIYVLSHNLEPVVEQSGGNLVVRVCLVLAMMGVINSVLTEGKYNYLLILNKSAIVLIFDIVDKEKIYKRRYLKFFYK